MGSAHFDVGHADPALGRFPPGYPIGLCLLGNLNLGARCQLPYPGIIRSGAGANVQDRGADDLSGSPYYINIKDLKTVPDAGPDDGKKKKEREDGIYVNVPGKILVEILNGSNTIADAEFSAGQFGRVELLSGDLFNKRFTTHLWLNPITGGVEKLEAEQPK